MIAGHGRQGSRRPGCHSPVAGLPSTQGADMSEHPDPLRLFARQALRTALVPAWFEALDLKEGDTVVDLGCGAGYVSLRAATAVGNAGTVHAVDSNTEAVAFLEDLAKLHGLDQIRCHVQSIPELVPLSERPRGALLTMVLHHLPEPAAALAHLAEALHGAPILIAEFDATGPCRVGPGREMRVSRSGVEAAIEEAGLVAHGFQQQTEEHWFVLASAPE
ncbi:methyltransferase domain-containing protein [Ectothiorhodospiraceae bacterium WFHF3C12]|nr:methyltransferase domain-containing protein [Ectothiorhodospiraceae bacterium WFHF3C12]